VHFSYSDALTYRTEDAPRIEPPWYTTQPIVRPGTADSSTTLASIRMAQKTMYLGSRWPDGTSVDTPIGMEEPARRPLSARRWNMMTQDSLRADEELTSIGANVTHAGLLWKASGRPPFRLWKPKWVYLMDDRLCWVDLEDVEGLQPGPNAAAVPFAVKQQQEFVMFPSALAGIGVSLPTPAEITHSPDTVQPAFIARAVRYLPLDRIPVRPTLRGKVAVQGISKVSDSQVDITGPLVGRSNVAFAVVSGSHTYFWAGRSAVEADAWVKALQDAWLRCTQHTARTCNLRVPEDNLTHDLMTLQGENTLLRQSLKRANELVRKQTGEGLKGRTVEGLGSEGLGARDEN